MMKHSTSEIFQSSRIEEALPTLEVGEAVWVDWWNSLEDGFCRTSHRGVMRARPVAERGASTQSEPPRVALG
jgi:hypothetical protein